MMLRKLWNLPTPGTGHEPMMRALLDLAATSWSQRALISEEGADFIRRILKAPKPLERRLSTHSCKLTMVSWAAKYGVPDSSKAVLARAIQSIATNRFFLPWESWKTCCRR